MTTHTSVKEDDGSVRTMTLIFLAILVLLPFAMDFTTKLFKAIGNEYAANMLATHMWLPDVLGYSTIYLFMMFYLLATFEGLAFYGYKWNREYLGLALYLGIGSAIVMFAVGKLTGYHAAVSQEGVRFGVFLGYLIAWMLPALVEETLFRGVIQGHYQRTLQRTFTSHHIHVAVFIGVIAELLFHVMSPIYFGLSDGSVAVRLIEVIPQLFYVAIFGFISGVLYQRTGSLVGPLLIHALGNGFELLLWYIF